MPILKNNELLDRAKKLRKEMTPQELRLWYRFLRTYPRKMYKQRIIGNYIVDFYCASAKLVIEVDGSQHYDPQKIEYDQKRTTYLEEQGLAVLRFTNLDVTRRFSGVCDAIFQAVEARTAQKT